MITINPESTKIIACATVMEEMLPIMPKGINYEVFDFGLHIRVDELKKKIQDAVNAQSKRIENIILGYGLCSQAVVGLRSGKCNLILPRVDDCVALFLGSQKSYLQQNSIEPGTYYLSKGWLEAGSTVFDEYSKYVERYGEEKAGDIMRVMIKNYKRLAFIVTGSQGLRKYRAHAKKIAKRWGLRYEEITGSNALLKKMLNGQLDKDFVVASPGQVIKYLDFKENER